MSFSIREQERIAKAELITQIANDAEITPAQANTAYETIIKTYFKTLMEEGYFFPTVTRAKRVKRRPRRPASRGKSYVPLWIKINAHSLLVHKALKRMHLEKKMLSSKEQINKPAEMDEVEPKEHPLLAHVRANMKYKLQDLIDECDPKQPWTENDLAWFNDPPVGREVL